MDDLSDDLIALDGRIEALQKKVDAQQKVVNAQPKKKWTQEQIASAWIKRLAAMACGWLPGARSGRHTRNTWPSSGACWNSNRPTSIPGKFKITELIPPKSLGPLNSLWDLRHYVTGRAPGGLVLAEDGSLDWERSFRTVDYFPALRSISVRNNVQPGLAPKPVDFIAVRIPRESLTSFRPAINPIAMRSCYGAMPRIRRWFSPAVTSFATCRVTEDLKPPNWGRVCH